MVTSLIAGTVVPIWDRRLVRAMNEAVLGIWDEPAVWRFGVMNDEGEIYRRVIVHGSTQYGRLLEALLTHGFYLSHYPDEIVISPSGGGWYLKGWSALVSSSGGDLVRHRIGGRLLIAVSMLPLDQGFDLHPEVTEAYALGETQVEAGHAGASEVFSIHKAAQRHEQDAREALMQGKCRCEAIHDWHVEVENGEIGRPVLSDAECRAAVGYDTHVVIAQSQKDAQALGCVLVVIGDQHSQRIHAAPQSCGLVERAEV